MMIGMSRHRENAGRAHDAHEFGAVEQRHFPVEDDDVRHRRCGWPRGRRCRRSPRGPPARRSLISRLRTILRMYWLSSTTSTPSDWISASISLFDIDIDCMTRQPRRHRIPAGASSPCSPFGEVKAHAGQSCIRSAGSLPRSQRHLNSRGNQSIQTAGVQRGVSVRATASRQPAHLRSRVAASIRGSKRRSHFQVAAKPARSGHSAGRKAREIGGAERGRLHHAPAGRPAPPGCRPRTAW